MKTQHEHDYKKGIGSVDVCVCGRFKHNEKAGPDIISADHTQEWNRGGNLRLKPFIYEQWHCWQGTADILLSNEDTKQLFSFKDIDDVINSLCLWNNKNAARALNKHKNEVQS